MSASGLPSISEAHETHPVIWRWPPGGRGERYWRHTDTEAEVASLQVIPLAWQTTRVLWAGEYGAGNRPACESQDGVQGRVRDTEAAAAVGVAVPSNAGAEEDAPLCAECPAARRTADNRPGPCKSNVVLWVLTPDNAERPIRVRIPEWAGGREWRRFVRDQGGSARLCSQVVEMSAHWDQEWPKLTLNTLHPLTEDNAATVVEIRDKYLLQMNVLGVDLGQLADQPAEAPATHGTGLFAPPADSPSTTASASEGMPADAPTAQPGAETPPGPGE